MKELLLLIARDIIKNRTIIAFTLLLFGVSWSIFSLEDSNEKALHTLANVVFMIIPLISIMFTTIYLYNSSEFIELLVGQPLKRSSIWSSFFAAISFSLVTAIGISVLIPLGWYAPSYPGLIITILAIFLCIIFTSLGFLSVILFKDKARGIGFSIILWMFFALIFDGLMLFLLFQFADYPVEKPLTIIAALNPVDVSRIFFLTELDNAALMGMTGALFKQFFGSTKGNLIVFFILLFWAFVPFLISLKKFIRKDI